MNIFIVGLRYTVKRMNWDLSRMVSLPYTIVGSVPARTIRKRFANKTIEKLLEI